MTNSILKQGVAAAEQERQEQQIKKIKSFVQAYLETIDRKNEEKRKIKEQEKDLDEQIALLKKDLDDLKAGRLDKIEERNDKDEKAKQTTLIIIRRVDKEYIPMNPWRSPWQVEWKVPSWNQMGIGSITTSGLANISNSTTTATNAINYLSGSSFANFATGSYTVSDGRTINL